MLPDLAKGPIPTPPIHRPCPTEKLLHLGGPCIKNVVVASAFGDTYIIVTINHS